tara:strand:+ start:2065 stop:3150 length:1086 start_codon:yes stop_codon:yes gene_type:complete
MKSAKKSSKSLSFFLPRYHTNLVGLTNYLIDLNIKTKFFSLKKSQVENYTYSTPELIPKISFHFFFKITLLDYFKIIKILKKKKYDLIIIRLYNFQFDICLPIFIKLFTNIKFLFYSQTDLSYYLNLNLYKKVKYFIYLNFFKSKILTPVFNIKKYKYNKYFLPFPFLLKMKNQKIQKTDYIKILTIGKFQERKNFFLLLKALEKVNFRFKLIIIGEKTSLNQEYFYRRIKKYINSKKLNDKVEIKANIDHKKINKYYNWCDFFILPSTNEPASISILEALSFKKPVICSSNNGSKCYIRENLNGYVFKDNNSISLKSKIVKMKKNFKNIQSILGKDKSYYLNENVLKKIYDLNDKFKNVY